MLASCLVASSCGVDSSNIPRPYGPFSRTHNICLGIFWIVTYLSPLGLGLAVCLGLVVACTRETVLVVGSAIYVVGVAKYEEPTQQVAPWRIHPTTLQQSWPQPMWGLLFTQLGP